MPSLNRMRRQLCRALVALVVLVALLVSAAGLGMAGAPASLFGRASIAQCFIFEMRGNPIPVSMALETVRSWVRKETPESSASVNVLRENRPISGDALLATGDLVSVSDGVNPALTYSVVVRGDVCGTGTTGISQLTVLAGILRAGSASFPQNAAADLDGSGAVGLADLVQAASYFSHPASEGPFLADAPQDIPQNVEAPAPGEETADTFCFESVPDYAGQAYIAVHDNVPYFPLEGNQAQSWENYSALDDLGRCGPAAACIGQDIMPTDAREPIGDVKPTGWQSVKYPDVVPGGYLYNRCHLIGFQLAAENANPNNLITGTRYLNVEGMLPFENMVADYVKETANHVLYRSTPVYVGDELVARGVLLEAASIEDSGEDILFCVFVYNVQPGVEIDYSTGKSSLSAEASPVPGSAAAAYILSLSTHKFHLPDCSTAAKLKPENRQDFTGTREEVVAMGYAPCGICRP